MRGELLGDLWTRRALAPRIALALGTLVYSLAVSVGFVWHADSLVTLLVILGLTLPWVVSGIHPRFCFALMALTTAYQLALDVPLTPANLLIFPAVYVLAERRSRAFSLPAAGLVVVGALVAAFRWGDDFSSGIVPFLATSGGAIAAWTLGNNTALRRAYAQSLERRADQLEREQLHLAQLAAAQERSRIARDLHDIISHSLAGVLTLSEASLQRSDLDDDHREVMQLIGSSCRGSLAELRRLLRLLHENDADDGHERPTVAGIRTLLLPLEVRGVGTRFDASPRAESLPEVVQVALFRVAQESLTNVQKHAGDHVREVVVSLLIGDAEVTLTVTDDGRGCTGRDDQQPSGFGLQGMAERVDLLDGALTVGARPGGGFQVRATVPLADVGTVAPGSTQVLPWERPAPTVVPPVPRTRTREGPALERPAVDERGLR